VKLPSHRPGLPGKVASFHIVLLGPTFKAGLVGHVPAKAHIIYTIPIKLERGFHPFKMGIKSDINFSLDFY
jgi:hypothetical protein